MYSSESIAPVAIAFEHTSYLKASLTGNRVMCLAMPAHIEKGQATPVDFREKSRVLRPDILSPTTAVGFGVRREEADEPVEITLSVVSRHPIENRCQLGAGAST